MVTRFTASSANGTDTAHLVQLFDSDDSLSDGVAQFLRQGLLQDDQILAVIDGDRWNAVAMHLAELGSPVDEALLAGRLVVRSANATLNTFMVGERPHPDLVAETVGTLVAGQAASGRPLRVYGEMVDVLAAQGEYAAALELEELWNELATEHVFTILCGYTAGHFGDPRNATDLRRICAAHSAVVADPQDVLGSFLVNGRGIAVAGTS
jgi:hypothetical protein